MPAYILHQNMRTFGSQAPRRNQAYRGGPVTPAPPPPPPPPMPPSWPAAIAAGAYGFPYVHGSTGGALPGFPEPLTPNYPRPWREAICIAGFTELASPNPHVIAEFSQILMGVDGGTVRVFGCGTTALSNRGPEWLGIAIAHWVEVLLFGRVSFSADEPRFEVQKPPFTDGWDGNPPDYGADRRWIIYAVVRLHPEGRTLAVGFIHNTYTLPTRFDLPGRMPYVIEAIRKTGPVRIDHVIIGGDFNLDLRKPGTRRPVYTYADCVKAGQHIPFNNGKHHGELGGTTWGGELYDYWLSDIQPGVVTQLVPGGVGEPQASVNAATWDGPASEHGLMSDHVATLLRIV